MDKDMMDFYTQIMQEPSPFTEIHKKPLVAEESQGKRLVRLAGKGLTFGLGQRDIEPSGFLEHATEMAGSIPSTVAASLVTSPLVAAGARGARLAGLASTPLRAQMTTSGVLGAGVGAGKALQSGNISDVSIETAQWLGGEAIGQGLLKGGAKLFGRNAPAPVKIVTTEGKVVEGVPLPAEPQMSTIQKTPSIAESIMPSREANINMAARKNIMPDIEPSSPQGFTEGSFDQALKFKQDEELKAMHLTEQLKAHAQQKEVDGITTPDVRESLMPAFTMKHPALPQELGQGEMPPLRFVREEVPSSGDRDILWREKPGLSDFTLGQGDDIRNPIHQNGKLLVQETDPITGVQRLTPLDEEAEAIVDLVKASPREVEPPLDPFQIEGINKPQNRAKLDVVKINEPLTTSNLVKKSEKEIERLTADESPNPTKFVTVSDSTESMAARQLLNKHAFSAEDIIDMKAVVEARVVAESGGSKENMTAVEYMKTKARYFKEEIERRRPC